ncbi:MAG: phosphatase PAP2 family protein [Ruegeria sp.]
MSATASDPDKESLRRLQPMHRHILLTAALSRGLGIDDERPATDGVMPQEDGKDLGSYALTRPKLVASDLDAIISRRWLRAERIGEIIEQQTDILSFLALAYPMTRDTHPFTMALLDAVLASAGKVVVQAKYKLNVPRPADWSAGISPIIRTPAHGATPSGHATESWAMAFAMESMIFSCASQELRMIAARIEENRIVAGVHYEHDGYMGRRLATYLAKIFADRLGVPNPVLDETRIPVWSEAGQAGLLAQPERQVGQAHAQPSAPAFTNPGGVLGAAMELSRTELGFPTGQE